jgi:hypothetical protein
MILRIILGGKDLRGRTGSPSISRDQTSAIAACRARISATSASSASNRFGVDPGAQAVAIGNESRGKRLRRAPRSRLPDLASRVPNSDAVHFGLLSVVVAGSLRTGTGTGVDAACSPGAWRGRPRNRGASATPIPASTVQAARDSFAHTPAWCGRLVGEGWPLTWLRHKPCRSVTASAIGPGRGQSRKAPTTYMVGPQERGGCRSHGAEPSRLVGWGPPHGAAAIAAALSEVASCSASSRAMGRSSAVW